MSENSVFLIRQHFTKGPIYICYNLSLILLRIKMLKTKVVEKIKTSVLCTVTSFFFFEKRTFFFQIIWKNILELGSPQMTIWRMRIARWIPKATNTHSECVILIAFPLQQWQHERASMLRYTYIASLLSALLASRLSSGNL